PRSLAVIGFAVAYLPVLVLAVLVRKKNAIWMFAAAAWVAVLGYISTGANPEKSLGLYLWVALGACGLCWWGVRDNRKLFINYGTVIFALDVVGFYFSRVLDKLGRSVGLILLGVIFLAGGWVLNRLRSDLIARAAAGGGQGQ